MKAPFLFSTIAICAITAGCASNPFATKQETSAPIPSPTPPVTEPLKLAAQGKVDAPPMIDVPPWYIKAPASTEEYVFITGTAVSSSLAMSRSKALLDAQYQLASKINGEIDAVMRQSRKDNDGKLNEDYTSLTIRKRIVETSVAGHHLEDSRVQAENKGYRTFVLVRYPIGQMNSFLSQKNAKEEKKEDIDKRIDKEVGKATVTPVTTTSQSSVELKPIPAPVVESKAVPIGELKLLEVENEEYKRRRAEALQKPGAVVGNTTIR